MECLFRCGSQRFVVEEGARISVGRDASCDVVVPSRLAPRVALTLEGVDGRCVVRAHGPSDVYAEGYRVGAGATIEIGAKLVIAPDVELVFVARGARLDSSHRIPSHELPSFAAALAADLASIHARGEVIAALGVDAIFVAEELEQSQIILPSPPIFGPMLLGNPRHLAPEVLRDRTIGAASDVFHLASIVYELAFGRAAWPGEGPAGIAGKLTRPPDPPPVLGDATLDRLAPAVLRALAPDPAERPSAAELAEAMRALAPSQDPRAVLERAVKHAIEQELQRHSGYRELFGVVDPGSPEWDDYEEAKETYRWLLRLSSMIEPLDAMRLEGPREYFALVESIVRRVWDGDAPSDRPKQIARAMLDELRRRYLD